MSRILRLAAAGILSAILSLHCQQQVGAAENGIGVYLLGMRGPLGGLVPPPGVYFQNDFYLYSGSAEASRVLPFNGQLIAGVKADVWLDIPTFMWSTPLQVLGGNLGFSASLPIGGPRISADVALASPLLPSVIGRSLRGSVTTVGDPVLASFIGWHSGNLHWTAGVAVNVPVGDYRAGSLANIAFNRWAADAYGGVTWLDPAIGVELSSVAGITFNGVNPATDYRTGTEFHIEFAAIRHFSQQWSAGLIGYHYKQLTGDSGSGARLGPFKGRVTALGGTIGYNFLVGSTPVSTRLKVLREFAVENRLEGTAGFLTVAIPLGVAGK